MNSIEATRITVGKSPDSAPESTASSSGPCDERLEKTFNIPAALESENLPKSLPGQMYDCVWIDSLLRRLDEIDRLLDALIPPHKKPESLQIPGPESHQTPPSQVYEYSPLNEDEIRVLELHPGTDEEILSCNLRVLAKDEFDLLRLEEEIEFALLLKSDVHSKFLSLPGIKSRLGSLDRIACLDIHYDALSYTWGGETPERDICVDGKLMTIAPNLEAALKNIRKDLKGQEPEKTTQRSGLMLSASIKITPQRGMLKWKR
jgi:hypothetical protein